MLKKILMVIFLLPLAFMSAQNFTIGTIPDTQNLTENDEDASNITKMTEWFVEKKDSLNLLFVASLGDMTQWGAKDQWERVRKSYNVFKDAKLPYAPCQGNHDPNLDIMNEYFPVSEFENMQTFGGNFNGMHNAFYLFSASGMDFIMVVIQTHDQFIGHYDTTSIEWANKIFNNYSNRHAIFITHDFFEKRDLVDDVIKKHDNIFLAICGHSCAREQYWVETSPNGRPVHCIMSDYQCDPDKGTTIRYYTFKPGEKEIEVFTYNVLSGKYETDENSQFKIKIPEKLLSKPVITSTSHFPVFPKSNEPISVEAKIFDNGLIKEAYVNWGTDSLKLENSAGMKKTDSGYTGIIPPVKDGSVVYYSILAKDNDNEHSVSKLRKFEICDDGSCLECPYILTQKAYFGKPVKVPGRLEVENYNEGCQGVAYFDNDKGNLTKAYRKDDVDIENCKEGGFNLAYIGDNEWLNYEINVKKTGEYKFELRTSSNLHGSVIHLEVDGKDISGPIKLEPSGGWQNWKSTFIEDIKLEKGIYNLKVVIDKGGFNFNYIDISK